MKLEASKKLIVDTSCCAGYREFTFFRDNNADTTLILNTATSNYIAGTVSEPASSAISITFPSLLGSNLNEKSVNVFYNLEALNISIQTFYNGDNTVLLNWISPSTIIGTFTIRIWTDQVVLI